MSQVGEELKKSNIVDGYLFLSADDADKAEMESKKIAYLMEHLKKGNAETMRNVYEKAIETRTFQTPVGISFMHRMRKQLLHSGYTEEDIKPIPIYESYSGYVREETAPAKQRIKPAEKKEQIDKTKISIFLNILLVLMVIGMFFIAKTADNPNIINYETAILDKYASWEQNLSERETIIREKELDLGLE